MSDTDLNRRAIAAWNRFPSPHPGESVHEVRTVEKNHKAYVVLSGKTQLLAVYRVRNDGQLKRLRRIPPTIGFTPPAPAPDPERQLYVFGSDADKHVRIGVSRDPAKRLSSMQTGNPYKLKILLLHPADDPALEADVHRHLALFRVNGEWFDFGAADPVVMVEKAITEVRNVP